MRRMVSFHLLMKQKTFLITFTGFENEINIPAYSALQIKDSRIITRRELVALISRGGSLRISVKMPFFSLNSTDGKPAALKKADLARRRLFNAASLLHFRSQVYFYLPRTKKGFKDRRWNPVKTRGKKSVFFFFFFILNDPTFRCLFSVFFSFLLLIFLLFFFQFLIWIFLEGEEER